MKPNPTTQELASTKRRMWAWTLLVLFHGKALTATGRRHDVRWLRISGRSLTASSLIYAVMLAWLAKTARQEAKEVERQVVRDAQSTSDIRAFPPG